MNAAEIPVSRPPELQDWLNRTLYHPLAMRLAKALVPTPVSPNMVSVLSGGMIVIAAIIYAGAETLLVVFLGLLFHMSWHILDGADGDLARLTGRTSSQGEIVDGICDYGGHIIMYVILATTLTQQIGSAAWWWMWAAGIGRVLQATHYEAQRRQYQHWVYDIGWLRATDRSSRTSPGIIAAVGQIYVLIGKPLAPRAEQVESMITSASAKEQTGMKQVIMREMAPVLLCTNPLSANHRTLVLGVSMAFGTPLYFFMYEAVILSVVLAISMIVAARAASRILAQAPAASKRR